MTSRTGPPTEPRRDAATRGFSLLELILVLALLALAAGAAAPALGRFTRGRQMLDTAADVLALAQYAADQAANQGVPWRLNLDANAGAYWLSTRREGAFAPPATDFGRVFHAPDGVGIAWEDSEEAAGRGYIQFNPDGSHDVATIRVDGRDGQGSRISAASMTEAYRVTEATP